MHVVLAMVCEKSQKRKKDGAQMLFVISVCWEMCKRLTVASLKLWFSLLESKIRRILRFEFLYVCLCESLVFYLDGSEHSVLYLDYMNESLDLFFSLIGWILCCVCYL